MEEIGDKKLIIFAAALMALIVVFTQIPEIIKHKKCDNNAGIYMNNGECYIPMNDIERTQILKDGYKNISRFEPIINFSLILK